MTAARFNTVSFDADSTLSALEGIDWLAARRGADVAARIRTLTERAMAGDASLDDVYGERLAAVRPAKSDVDALATAYVEGIAPGARACVAALREAGVRVLIISGGIRQALGALARACDVTDADVYAVPLRFTPDGAYGGYDEASPLVRQRGKGELLAALSSGLSRPILHVGDGATDVAARGVGSADAFLAYTGFVHRERVVADADAACAHFSEIAAYILP